MAEFGALWCGSSQTNPHNRTTGARIKSHPCPSPSVECGQDANQKLLRSRPNLPAENHNARSIQISLCTHHTLQCTAKRANFFSNATNVHLWDISEQSVWERFCLGNAIWSPHLLAFTFLFVWLPDAWLQQQPWQRGSWQAEKARGIAPLCCRPPPPSSTPSPPRVLAPQRRQDAARPKDLQVQLTGRPPLLSRLACPQIINPNAPAAFTKPHLINVPPHKYKLYPPPSSQLRCLFRSQYPHELGWFC